METYVLEDKDWGFREIRIYKNNNQYELYFRTSDYDLVSYSTYEYKLDEFRIYARLLEDRNETPGKDYYDVRDGVVLESDIMERSEKDKRVIIGSRKKHAKDEIERLKKECEFKEIKRYDIKYFILSRYPDLLSKQGLKKYFRGELERIKLGLLNVKNLCKKYKFTMTYDEEMEYCGYIYDDYKRDDKKTSEYIDKFNKKLTAICKQSRCDRGEVDQSKKIIKILEGYLEIIS